MLLARSARRFSSLSTAHSASCPTESRGVAPSRRFMDSILARATPTCLVCLVTLGIAATPAQATETFGIKSFESSIASNAEGAVATQAGSHPYALTTTVFFNHEVTEEKESFDENLNEEQVPSGEPKVFAHIYGNPKHLEVNLPAGLTVDPAATSVRCTEAQLEDQPQRRWLLPSRLRGGDGRRLHQRPGRENQSGDLQRGAPAGCVRGARDRSRCVGPRPPHRGSGPYRRRLRLLRRCFGNLQTASIYGLRLTLWGDPSEASHDAQRGVCAASGYWAARGEEPLEPVAAVGVMASVLGLIQTHLVTEQSGPLIELLGPLMGFVTSLSLDKEDRAREVRRGAELAREIKAGDPRWSPPVRPPRPSSAPDVALPATLANPGAHRARECLLFLAEQGARGFSPSNREIGIAIGVTDKSQISRLLAYLAGENLVVKRSEGRGKRNASGLTPRGEEIARALER